MRNSVISVENLTKRYDLGVIGTGTLSRDLERWWAHIRKQPDPFTKIGQETGFKRHEGSILALDDVSFTVEQGDVLGIIGKNGAGKSTLLKILSRVTAPTSGAVKIKGRIGSLLEVGTGFHPELTGRENVFLNGAILGMRKAEVQKKFDEIVDFSGVEQFIDTPVKRYSSGMYVRLAFAVAAHLDPEILIVDEVLAVGDAEFQKKCLGKMSDVAGEGRTVLFVSHNIGSILKLCPISLWMSEGTIRTIGETGSVIEKYLLSDQALGNGIYHFYDGKDQPIYFKKVELKKQNGDYSTSFTADEPILFRVTYQVNQKLKNSSISIIIMNSIGDHLWEFRDIDQFTDLFDCRYPGEYIYNCTAPSNVLKPGTYRLQLGSGIPGKRFHRPSNQILFEVTTTGFWRMSHSYFGLTGGPIVVPMKADRPILQSS